MSYDETLAARVRNALAGLPDITERKMFGGLAFLAGGHLCCGIVGADLMVRVGSDAYETALRDPAAREMDFTGRALNGLVYVAPHGVASSEAVRRWVGLGLQYVGTLPPKPTTRARTEHGQRMRARRRPSVQTVQNRTPAPRSTRKRREK